MPVLSLSFPLPPFLRTSGNSNGHQSEPVAPAGGPRYFPETEIIGVVWGALRLRSGGWGISENLKFVHLARGSAGLPVLAVVSYGQQIVSRAARKSEQRALSLRLVESQGSCGRAYPISLCRQYVVVPPIYKVRHGMRKLLGSAFSYLHDNYSFIISRGELRALFSHQMEVRHG